ncbi:DnaJ domain-containing protein [Thiomicrospira microaerophila]|uniref:DnaJ domain-containing protein n=1 Tax=Thiomicrospira microaerophila TaxID=406020 RepID=UPI0005C90741|nr:DnaJ domain-containing protein [Thiomicrospira microaerophila]
MKFIKYLLLIAVFILVKLFGWLFKGTRKTLGVGVDAYRSVKNSQNFEEAYRNFASNKYAKARLSIPEEIIALMAKIAASDGKISELEIEYMSDTIKSIANAMLQAGLNATLVDQIKQKLFALANQAKKDDKPISYYCYALSQAGIEVRTAAFLQIIAFASIDGLSDKTKTMLFQIGEHLAFNKQQIEQLFEQVNGRVNQSSYQKDPYEVLGCSEEDDFAIVKQAYRQLVKQYHPDFMHSKGLDDAQIKTATEKMQAINAAFEEIKRRMSD